MKEFKKIFLLLLTVLLLIGSLYSMGWAGDQLSRDDTVVQGWSLLDLLVARPLSVVAGVGGSAIFVVTLPFTLPSGTTKDAAHMFIVEPFQFSFKREVPDKDINFGRNQASGSRYD
jgi:hypothetical protein